MFIQPMNVLLIQDELKKYRELCLRFQHSPAKEEFDDIVQFILLHSGNNAEMHESINYKTNSTINYLYETFIEDLSEELNERGDSSGVEIDAAAETDTAVALTYSTAKKALVGALGLGVAAVLYIGYLMKRGKLKSAMDKEQQLEMQKLKLYEKVVTIAIKLAKLKGEPQPKLTDLTRPSLTNEPPLPEAPKDDEK